MKKKTFFAFVLLIALCVVLTSCGKISEDKAVDLAIKSIGSSKVYVQKWEVELDKTSNVYKVTTWKDGKYVIGVDAKSGAIVSTDFTPGV